MSAKPWPTTSKDLSQLDHRRMIGTLGLLLPVLIYLIAGLRATESLARWQLLDAVSDYYYTGAVAVFVGVLFALSLFLFTYPGYEGAIADRVVGAMGGLGALFVALFPTLAPTPALVPGWWSKLTGVLHYISAVTMFVSFILFSLWLFRRSDIPDHRDRPREKQRRNRRCSSCAGSSWSAPCSGRAARS